MTQYRYKAEAFSFAAAVLCWLPCYPLTHVFPFDRMETTWGCDPDEIEELQMCAKPVFQVFELQSTLWFVVNFVIEAFVDFLGFIN